MIFDRLCGSDRFSTHEKWSIILKSSGTQSKIINPPLRGIHLFPHSFAKSHRDKAYYFTWLSMNR